MFKPSSDFPITTFQVGSSLRACGDSNLKLNGQPLDVQWHDTQGSGQDDSEAHFSTPISWTVKCLYNIIPRDGSPSHGEDVVHVFTLISWGDEPRRALHRLTVSYRQYGYPSILRWEPSDILLPGFDDDYEHWSTPISPSMLEKAAEHPMNPAEIVTASPHAEQKNLQSHLVDLKAKFQEKIHKAIDLLNKLCHGQASEIAKQEDSRIHLAKLTKNSTDPDILPDKLEVSEVEVEVGYHELDYTVTPTTHPNPIRLPPAAETRSIEPPESPFDPSSPSLSYDQPVTLSAIVLKSFFLALSVFSLLTWLYLHFHDPRRRADRAARREERRTKRLYRRAARRQKIRNWFWAFRMKHGFASPDVLSSNEKHARVTAQENILEIVMKDDIRALRNAHRVVSSMTSDSSAAAAAAAEEGHAGLAYNGGEQSHRRLRSVRSVSTLPGYESEGSQPPPYRYDDGRRGSVAEFTSDSSVVSTSPRISRDGTSSDFEEKIEDINLEEHQVVDGLRGRK